MTDGHSKLQLDVESTLQPINLEEPLTLEYAQQFAYTRPAKAVLKALTVDPEAGLHSDQVSQRQNTYGSNELNDESGVSYLQIFARQVLNAMTMVLLIAFIVSMSIKSWIEGGVIGFVVALNIAIGFFQEAAAEKTMASLRALASPTAHVIRAGEMVTVPSSELVPGDIVELASGDQVPADLRLFEASNLEADEALLTGEAMPVSKLPKQVLYDPDTPVGDRINLAYMSSTITKGRGTGVVVTTGMQTEIGLLAGALQGPSKRSKLRQVKEASYGKKVQTAARVGVGALWDKVAAFLGLTGGTPLQRKLSVLAIALFCIAVIFAIICFAANNWTDNEVILYAVATGVAMIPASLPAVLAITMAKGAQAMTTRGVIVRKASAIEALGAVTDICSDKTGTLTQGRMIVKQVWLPAEGVISVADSEAVFDPRSGRVSKHVGVQPKDLDLTKPPQGSEHVPLDQDFRAANQTKKNATTDFLNVVSLCNNAKVLKDKETNKWVAHGDFTECALQTFAHRFGWGKPALTRSAVEDDEEHKKDPAEWEMVHENAFSSDVKRMSVVYHHHPSGRGLVMMKGAVERVLDACTSFSGPSGTVELDEQIKSDIMENVNVLASQGLRVLGNASRPVAADEPSTVPLEGETEWQHLERSDVERNMTFVGLAGIYDPPRPSSAPAIAKCHGAGIEVHMLTGDHLGTARAIAQEIGILPSEAEMPAWSEERSRAMVMTGPQVDKMSEEELDRLPDLPLVVARCSPQTKVRMIEALHRRSTRCVVMTGDGVNDAPSLKMADIGIGMGSGSDVAIGVADLVLSDDNFASIVSGIEEGRRTFDNIKKFVLHLLAQNIAQALTLLIALAFKDKDNISVFPLAPVEILWVIMVASGLPAMALGFEPAAEDVMDRPPHNIKTGIFTLEVILDLLVYGVWVGALCLSTFAVCVWGFGPGTLADSWNCNKPTSAHDRGECRPIFRARGTTWAVMVICSLLLAWEMVHPRRSFFRMRNERAVWSQWWFDTWGRNKLLFATVVGGAIAIPPILYIPVISDKVFLHSGISWEWGVVAVTSLLFMLGVELWKWAKRVYLRRCARESRDTARQQPPSGDEKSAA